MSLLDAIAKLLGRDPAPSVQPCLSGDGILCVVVGRRDQPEQGVPDVRVSLQGPSPGETVTDGTGIAEFQSRIPGDYDFRVELSPGRFRGWKVVDYDGNVGVSEGRVTVADVRVYATGTLVVEIRQEDTGELLPDPADVTVSGPQPGSVRTVNGTHTFAGIACGEYEVSARVSTKFDKWTVSAPRVLVPEGGTVTARMVVSPRTWIEIELLDDEDAGIAGEEYLIVAPDGQEMRGTTDARGRARIEGIVPGQCKISFPKLDKDSWRPA